MFDIGFSEVLLIFVIALVVLGPEKLPRLASQVGRWIGRARAMARQFREQLEEEVNLEQVRKAQEQKPKTTTPPADATPQGQQTAGAAAGAAQANGVQQNETHTGGGSGYSDPGYTGPDPADLRADTFSHAHPTNEYGANPHTSNGAAEEPAAPAAGPEANAPGVSAQSQFAFDSRTASEANVAAAQPQPEARDEQRAAPDEAYAARRPRDNTPGTDNHGN